MEQLQPDEELTSQLWELRSLLKAVKSGGEDVAFNRSLHIHSWLQRYLESQVNTEDARIAIIQNVFEFYNPETTSLNDWRDKMALIPLRLLVTFEHPSWEVVSPKHIENCLELAGD
jgi:hypothetical protein